MTASLLGSVAPAFALVSSHGEQIDLVGLAGRPVALFFFPYAFTGVCTGELVGLAERYPAMRELGAEVIAISTDSHYTLRALAESEQLPFTLLSDFWPHGAVARRYGCFEPERGCAERASFVLDTDHRVRWTDRSGLGRARDIGDQLAALAALDRPPG